MYLGEYRLGDTVPLLLRTVNAAGTPTEPNDCPQLVVWQGSTDLYRAELPIIERAVNAGTFSLGLFLGAGFAEGNCSIQYRYVLPSNYIGSSEDTFRIVAGGNADGAVTSMYFYDRPQAKFIVHGTETGRILKGKNPSI